MKKKSIETAVTINNSDIENLAHLMREKKDNIKNAREICNIVAEAAETDYQWHYVCLSVTLEHAEPETNTRKTPYPICSLKTMASEEVDQILDLVKLNIERDAEEYKDLLKQFNKVANEV